MVLSLQINDDGGGLTGAARRHRTDHTLLGKLACRRLAKLLPGLVTDNGTAAVVSFALVEWLVTPFIRQESAASLLLIYANVLGWERMGVALDRALSKILDDTPRHAGVLRAQLRRAADAFNTCDDIFQHRPSPTPAHHLGRTSASWRRCATRRDANLPTLPLRT